MAHWLPRLLKHRLFDEGDARRALGTGALTRIEARVAASEARHSGQIRVCVEAGLPLSYLLRGASARDRAVAMFGKLRVWDTEHNNGVLIYLLLAERAIEIVADRGIDARVDTAAWAAIATRMQGAFRGGDFAAGLDRAIDAVDALLVQHFPRVAGSAAADYPNELPDAPVIR
jgi:uncharacterized membrane protein YgcG